MLKSHLFIKISFLTLFSVVSYAESSTLDMTKCIGCHGMHFEKPAMSTSRIVKDLTKEEIYTALLGYKNESKGGAMQSVMSRQMANFSTKEIEELSDNIVKGEISQHPKAENNISIEILEVNTDGCISCHGENFEKPAMGISRIVNTMSKDDIIASINGYRDGSYGGDKKALMAGVAMKLSFEEIEAIGEIFGVKVPPMEPNPIKSD
jgi:cytochrome c553